MGKAIQGVYQIRNKLDGRCYVGSSRDVRGRWKGHRHLLKGGRHHSPRLQRAWMRDGESAFEFRILEVVNEVRDLPCVEQAWIDFLHAYAPRGGYNVLPFAGRTFGRKHPPERIEQIRMATKRRARSYEVVWPHGEVEIVHNLSDFCAGHGFTAHLFRAAALSGGLTSGGFRVRKVGEPAPVLTPKPSKYILRHPDGREEPFRNIAEMARRIGVHDTALRDCIKGRSRHAKGFSAWPIGTSLEVQVASMKANKPRWRVVSDKGQVSEVPSLMAYAEDHGLKYSSFYAAAKAGRPYQGHRAAPILGG